MRCYRCCTCFLEKQHSDKNINILIIVQATFFSGIIYKEVSVCTLLISWYSSIITKLTIISGITLHSILTSICFNQICCFLGPRYFCRCGKNYKNPESLCRHRRECGVEKKYQCPYCSHKSHRQDNLKRHVVLHFVGKRGAYLSE